MGSGHERPTFWSEASRSRIQVSGSQGRAFRPLLDRARRLLTERGGGAEPEETALFVKHNVFSLVYVAAMGVYGLGFAVMGRTVHAVLSLVMFMLGVVCWSWGRRASTERGIRMAAAGNVTIGVIGLATMAALGGPIGAYGSWFMPLGAAAAVFLLSRPAALGWSVVVIVALLMMPSVAQPPLSGDVYVERPWELPASQVAMTIILIFFAGATRRATEAHVASLVAHERETRRQNEQLQALVSANKEAEEELRTAYEQLREALVAAERARLITEDARRVAEEANFAKSRFLANMSHELRTPLNAVIGYAELVAEDAVDAGVPQLVPDLERVRGAGEHLLRLINDLLDIAKIEAGRTDLQVEPVSIPDLVRDVKDTIRPLAVSRANQFVVHVSPRVDRLRTDATRLRQLLENLLSNACKFTESGTVELVVERARDMVRFVIRDTGIGMTTEQLETVFEPFRQADPSTTRRYGGTGLGLALVRSYVEILGGVLEVTSEPSVGTTFVVRLPITAHSMTDALPVAVDDRPADSAATERTRVVVIGDDPAVRAPLVGHLERRAAEIWSAATGEAGIRLVKEHAPDVVFVDVTLPRMDGWGVLTLLRGGEGAGVPVVMITSEGEEEVAVALGAAATVSKPLDPRAVEEVLGRVCAGRGRSAGKGKSGVDDGRS